jgi:hypothetical protein
MNKLLLFAFLFLSFSGCSSISGKWSVDTEKTLSAIKAIPLQSQEQFSSLNLYKANQKKWLSELVAEIKKYKRKGILDTGDYTFIIDSYFAQNPYRAKLMCKSKDKNIFAVNIWISGWMSMKDGILYHTDESIIWTRTDNLYGIHLKRK